MSTTDCLYPRTAAIPFCTESDLSTSSSTIASLGSITSGLPEPKPPYLAALAWPGSRVRDAATAAADCCKNPIRVVTPFSALSAVKDRIIDERGRGGGKLNINVNGVYKRSIHSQIHKPLVTK